MAEKQSSSDWSISRPRGLAKFNVVLPKPRRVVQFTAQWSGPNVLRGGWGWGWEQSSWQDACLTWSHLCNTHTYVHIHVWGIPRDSRKFAFMMSFQVLAIWVNIAFCGFCLLLLPFPSFVHRVHITHWVTTSEWTGLFLPTVSWLLTLLGDATARSARRREG